MPLPSTPHEDRAAKGEEAKERAAARKAALAKDAQDAWLRPAAHNKEHGPWTETPKPVAKEPPADEPPQEPPAEETKPQGRLANFVFSGDEPSSPQAMLIDGVMPLQGLPFIGGQSSAGKTFIAVMLACCAATGKPFMGREVKERVGSVIVAAEGRMMLAARIDAALQALNVTETVPVSWIKQVPDFSRAESVKDFIANLRAVSAHYKEKFDVPLGLVFVDTVSASFDIKEEADNAEAARVCKIMRDIADATGVVIVPIYHYGKNAGVGLRGASAWRANADFVLSVMADIDPATGHVTNRQLAIAKDRDGAQGPLTPFKLERVDLGVSRRQDMGLAGGSVR